MTVCHAMSSAWLMRFANVTQALTLLTRNDFSLRVAVVILLMYYSFGIIGIECFSGLELKNCCVLVFSVPVTVFYRIFFHMDSLQVVSQTNDCLSKRPHEDQARSNVRCESDIFLFCTETLRGKEYTRRVAII